LFRPKVILVGILALLMIILVVQNSEVVKVTLLFWSFEMSRVILILLASMTGFVCGYLVARLTPRRSDSS